MSKVKLSPYQEYIHKSRYARWVPELGRRENWDETVHRYVSFFAPRIPKQDREITIKEIEDAILQMEVMPSMRAMMTAGEALEKDNCAGYNCSYIAVDDPRAFDEAMYISMCGTGVGFSVERQYVNQLPYVAEVFYPCETIIKVKDSKIGWANSFRQLIALLYGGSIPKWDLSAVRPAGSPLKTFGGRASGPDPLERLFKFAIRLFQNAAGRKLTSVECHDLMCMVADIVVSGGVRRSAMISLSNLSDERMRNAKNGQWWIENDQRRLANNSVAYTEKPDMGIFMKEWFTLYESRSGERGIFNREGARKHVAKYGRRKWDGVDFGTNPCLTGDTLVYVADGRGNIPISQLAQEGKDVPVFCFNDKGKLITRWMRNPRLTGHQTPIVQVLLDDGSCLKVTENHKFKLKSGVYSEARELKAGDSLSVVTRFEASIKDVFKTANSNSQDYFWLNCGQSRTVAEHRVIAEGAYGVIPKGFVVHHKDFNAQNNTPCNLEVMSKQAHDSFHSEGMMGDLNPMRRAQNEWSEEKWLEYSTKMSQSTTGEHNGRYSGISNEALKQHALLLSEQTGHRFSKAGWVDYAQRNGLPQHFSGWRESHLNGIMGLAKWAAFTLGFDYVNADPRVVDTYTQLSQEGYDCSIIDGAVVINKKCEVCATPFTVPNKHREIGVCGQSCAGKRAFYTNRETIITAMKASHSRSREYKRQEQLEVYSKLQWDLGRIPLKDEWSGACRGAEVSAEISRSSSPFSSWSELQEASLMHNHKVVSVTPCGTADVYNGTVDEFHNFFVGAFEGLCANGKRKWVYVNNLQCGEILLRPKGFCNLTEVVVRPDDTKASLKKKIRKATIVGTLQSTLVEFRYLRKEWQKNAEEERLLGVSLTGIMDNKLMATNGAELAKLLDELREYAVEVNKEWAEKLGINVSVAITCIKPSGTVSQLVDSSSGIHTRYAKYIERAVREDKKNPIGNLLRDVGVKCEPDVTKPNDVDVFYFPLEPPAESICRNDLNAIQQLELYLTYKLHWTEHNPSCTIYVREHEWLAVAAWVYQHFDDIGGVSFLPHADGGHIYKQAPYTEITKEEYTALLSKSPQVINWGRLSEFEKEDQTTGMKELACSAGVCEIS